MTEKDVIDRLIELHGSDPKNPKMSWRAIAELPEYQGISSATALRAYAFGGRPIKNENDRMIFGLLPLVETVCCAQCGDAPTVCLCDGKKVVKTRPKKYKSLWSMPSNHLLHLLQNREEL